MNPIYGLSMAEKRQESEVALRAPIETCVGLSKHMTSAYAVVCPCVRPIYTGSQEEEELQSLEDYDYEEEKGETERARGMIEELDVSQSPQKPLPVMEHREAIIDALRHHDLMLVEGDTGCGKSTQVRPREGSGEEM